MFFPLTQQQVVPQSWVQLGARATRSFPEFSSSEAPQNVRGSPARWAAVPGPQRSGMPGSAHQRRASDTNLEHNGTLRGTHLGASQVTTLRAGTEASRSPHHVCVRVCVRVGLGRSENQENEGSSGATRARKRSRARAALWGLSSPAPESGGCLREQTGPRKVLPPGRLSPHHCLPQS